MREININVRTAEERASLALFYSNKKRVISAVFVFFVFKYKVYLEQSRGYCEERRILIRLLKV